MNKRENITVGERFAQAGREFRPAFKTALPYMLLGLVLGLAFLLLQAGLIRQHIVQEADFLAKLLEHVGVGFLVAAIAVFGYEWSAHIPKANELTEDLIVKIGQAEKITVSLAQSDRLVRAMAEQEELRKIRADEGLQRCIRATLRIEDESPRLYLHDVATRCQEYVNLISSLEKREKWTDPHYIEFISDLFEEIIGRNARSLAALWAERRAEDGEQHILFPLDAQEIGDRILEAHMKALGQGDLYCVVSDLTSWDHRQLQRFRRATKYAIEEKGVVVRRIFDLKRHRTLKRQWMREILVSHVRDAREWRGEGDKIGYEVLILGPEEYKRARKEEEDLTEERISQSHFGLFIHKKTSVVRVQVKKPDLSDLLLSTATAMREINLDSDLAPTHDPFIGIVNDDLKVFRGLYKAAFKLFNDGDIDDALDRLFAEKDN